MTFFTFFTVLLALGNLRDSCFTAQPLTTHLPFFLSRHVISFRAHGQPLTMSYPQECLHTIFRAQASRTPSAVALLSHEPATRPHVTYAELDGASDRLAAALLRMGVQKNDSVGILMSRRMEYALAYVGILKAGAGYGVMDPAYPEGLLQDVLERSSPRVVVTTRSLVGRLPDSQPVIVLREGWEGPTGCLPDELTDEDRQALAAVDGTDLDSLAYIVFSSGTTGKPKGIACPHRGAVFSYHRRYEQQPYANMIDPAAAQEIEACNVFFVWEMLRPLLKGQALSVIPDNVIYDPNQLTKHIESTKATRMLFTPSLLEAVVECQSVPAEETSRRMASLKYIVYCGEVVTAALHRRATKLLPGCRFVNLYSVSECHDVSAVDLTERDVGSTVKYCPVGELFDGVRAHVLDEKREELADGEVGELYVAGPTLALRYIGQEELTAERFPTINGERMYKTGDRARVLPNRELEILGRCDSMVKVRGYSVELRAIEAALLSLPGGAVSSCVVVAQGDEGEDKVVIGYVVLATGTTARSIRRELKGLLPHYMIPSFLVELEELPTHAVSGKLDKGKLPKVDVRGGGGEVGVGAGADSDCTSPRTKAERDLHEIWCDLMKLAKIDVVYDNFFDCGGHSLLAATLVARVSEAFDKPVGVIDLYTHSTIEKLAEFIARGDDLGEEKKESAEPAFDLEAEVALFDATEAIDVDIPMRAFWRTIHYQVRTRSALITGSTGYLGSFLLYELLTTMDVDVVYCIVRRSADASITALDRIKTSLADRGLWREGFESRIRAVTGDASLHHLGLDDDDYAALSMSVDLVVHCAALVNLVYPYQGLRSANVLGTSNMISFAVQGKVKRFAYISTNGIFPETGAKDCAEDADITLLNKKLVSGYGQSKWVAERLVQKARSRGLPAIVFRPGNMGGDSGEHGGSQTWNPSDLNYLFLTGCIQLGAAPEVDGWTMEMTPVDVAANAIVHILQDSKALRKSYHVTNFTNCLTANEYFDSIRETDHVLENLTWDEWRERLFSSSNPSLVKLKGAVAGLDENYFSDLSTMNNDNFVAACSKFDVTLPHITTNLMGHYVDHWQKVGVIPPPRRVGSRALRGKVVLITGASSGIGAAIAKALASAGASVAIGGRRLDRLKDLADKLSTETGSRVFPYQVDVTVRVQVKEFVVESERALGSCDIFCNNAGVMNYTRLEHGHEDLWEREVDVNCKGLLHGIGAVLPGMITRGRGHILATSSDAGRKVFPGLSVYSASKFFVEATCQGLRLETADKGIKVTTIQPGDCKTELSNNIHDSVAFGK